MAWNQGEQWGTWEGAPAGGCKAAMLPVAGTGDEMTGLLLKAGLIWAGIALAETLNGVLRVSFLNRPLGDRSARRVGVLTGSLMIFLIGWLSVPWIGPESTAESLAVGITWLLLMLAFDIGFGRMVFRASWRRIVADFDLTKGNLLSLGMLVLLLTPLAVGKLRGLF